MVRQAPLRGFYNLWLDWRRTVGRTNTASVLGSQAAQPKGKGKAKVPVNKESYDANEQSHILRAS